MTKADNTDNEKKRITIGSNISNELWFWTRVVATNMSRPRNIVYANKLIDESMIDVIKKYEEYLDAEQQNAFYEYVRNREQELAEKAKEKERKEKMRQYGF